MCSNLLEIYSINLSSGESIFLKVVMFGNHMRTGGYTELPKYMDVMILISGGHS
jgi:hypothetical protein